VRCIMCVISTRTDGRTVAIKAHSRCAVLGDTIYRNGDALFYSYSKCLYEDHQLVFKSFLSLGFNRHDFNSNT
jgi:hypothetical protein